ncbi:MAG: PBP1A family penicillin-binding protein [Bdellovibrionaceae bacterium]|nr:PBP1A family penicillin-binding protein [Pseudobdellovibrionaceae bacterium]
MRKRIIIIVAAFFTLIILAAVTWIISIKSSLPQILQIKDYKPLLVSPVYDRKNKKIGEFFRERRTLVSYERIPEKVIQAFLASEDDQFFSHSGINYFAIMRAMLANMRAGRNVQGGSTITQQVAKTFFLSREKTFDRKIREAMLAYQLEDNLKKEEILYLYLNQINFGHGCYGIENASQTYFKKSVSDITVAEAAILAGLPQAPSRYSPVLNPQKAKDRQKYVLHRMATVGFITHEEAEKWIKTPVKVYVRDDFEELAPYYQETIRQILVQQLGEDMVLDKGIRINTSLDLEKQLAAQASVREGLKSLDKRQGFRGPLQNIVDAKEIEIFLEKQKKELILETTPERTINVEGNFDEIQAKKQAKNQGSQPGQNQAKNLDKNQSKDAKIPSYLELTKTYRAVVSEVNDADGLTYVDLPEVKGVIDMDSMKWARQPDSSKKHEQAQISKPSDALKKGDVILVKLVNENVLISRLKKPMDFSHYIAVELDQEPEVEGALISFDQDTQEILAMVGGYQFIRNKNEFNRTVQAVRQTGSAFKAIVFASALDKNYDPSSELMDAPLVYEEAIKDQEGQQDTKIWKPTNHGKSFGGQLTFRNALVQSLNIPAVRLIEDVGVPWAMDYSKRLGIFSPLNNDFTLALGSSSLTLYEMTKVFAQFGRLGKRIRPLIIKSVIGQNGEKLLENVSLDIRFKNEIENLDKDFDERRKNYVAKKSAETNVDPNHPQAMATESETPDTKNTKTKRPDEFFFFDDEEQLIRPQTAYVMTSLLKGVVEDENGTAARARSLGREVAGKTGTTNGYVDAWFVGYTPQIATGVWVGYDKEKTIGKGEVGGRAALPLWLEYMKSAHNTMPQASFTVPSGIVFANVDAETGKLATAASKNVIKQAYIEGTEPTLSTNKGDEAIDFLKQEVNE